MRTIYEVLTADWLKSVFLFGVELLDDNGDPFPDIMFAQSIRSSVKWLERELGLHLGEYEVEGERHDAYEPDRSSWWLMQLDHGPVWKVDTLSARFGNFPEAKLSPNWVQRSSDDFSHVQLIPSGDSISSFQFTGGVPLIIGDVFNPSRYVPGYFVFDYVAGFPIFEGVQAGVSQGDTFTVEFDEPWINSDYDVTFSLAEGGAPAVGEYELRVTRRRKGSFTVQAKTLAGGPWEIGWVANTIPADIMQAIGYKASLVPLDVAGDLIIGAGIANQSISMDGLSQSIGTTSSATNAGYGARVRQFERELDKLLPALKARYRTPNVAAI